MTRFALVAALVLVTGCGIPPANPPGHEDCDAGQDSLHCQALMPCDCVGVGCAFPPSQFLGCECQPLATGNVWVCTQK